MTVAFWSGSLRTGIWYWSANMERKTSHGDLLFFHKIPSFSVLLFVYLTAFNFSLLLSIKLVPFFRLLHFLTFVFEFLPSMYSYTSIISFLYSFSLLLPFYTCFSLSWFPVFVLFSSSFFLPFFPSYSRLLRQYGLCYMSPYVFKI